MNVAFFLTPKSEVVWVGASGTVQQALERMKPNGFGAVPILDDDGCYAGTLSTSDLLWYLDEGASFGQLDARESPLRRVPRRLNDSPVHIDADIATLFARAVNQSFVPVVDDRDVFIGIVRRRPIIEFCARTSDLTGSTSAALHPSALIVAAPHARNAPAK